MLAKIGVDTELFGWDEEEEDWKEMDVDEAECEDGGEQDGWRESEGGLGLGMGPAIAPIEEGDDSWME
jgi:hypothetical protein